MTNNKDSQSTVFEYLRRHLGDYPFGFIFTCLFFLVFASCILYLVMTLHVTDGNLAARNTNLLTVLIGAMTEWAMGIYLAPFSQEETTRFQAIGKTVSAFVTGYVVSKIDRFLEATLFSKEQTPQTVAWEQLALFLVTFLLAAIVIFIYRLYAFRFPHKGQERESSPQS